DVAGEPFFVVVAANRTPAVVRGFQVDMPEYDSPFRRQRASWEDEVKEDERIATERIALLAGALQKALGAPAGDLAARAADARAARRGSNGWRRISARSASSGTPITSARRRSPA